MRWLSTFCFAFCTLGACAGTAGASPNYHLLGWLNTVVPGSGQTLLGDPLRGAAEATVSVGAFAWGYSLSRYSPLGIDGVPEALPRFGTGVSRNAQMNLAKPIYADYLQELGIKTHMTSVFLAYREAAVRSGDADGIDQSPVNELFLAPFQTKYLFDPWVYLPLAAVLAATVVDYSTTSNTGTPTVARLTPYTNFLYALNYMAVQPIGSGAPEEMFYRGFLRNELNSLVPSPWFSVPLSAAAFAFSHEVGDGRIGAAITGLYLGYLAHRNNGDLKPGITIHFWGVVMLGIETVFLSHLAQKTTPPGGLYMQINY